MDFEYPLNFWYSAMKILIRMCMRIFTTVYHMHSERFRTEKGQHMSEMVKVVVDAMGGDNAPEEPVKAAVEAVKEKENIQVILTGVQDVIEAELRKYPDYLRTGFAWCMRLR